MVNSWETFAHEFRIGRCFIPAYAADRIVVSATGVGAHLPAGGARSTDHVVEPCHRRLKGQHSAVLHERVRPELRASVSAVIHEPFEGAVGDLVTVNPVIRQVNF